MNFDDLRMTVTLVHWSIYDSFKFFFGLPTAGSSGGDDDNEDSKGGH